MGVPAGRVEPGPVNGARARFRLITELRIHGLAFGIAILAMIVRFWVSHQTHALGEDALITLRYAENIAVGYGWAYNPGEHVLGTTTPLFTLILACAAWLHLPAMPFGIALNILADGCTCYLVFRLLASPDLCRPIAGLFAALIYALSSTPISVSISGMETALVTCVGMAAIHSFIAGRARTLCLCGALLFLLRIDGLLLFGILIVGLTVSTRKFPWQGIGVFLLIIAPWLLFATLYFGSPVPASVTAKLTVYTHTAATPGSFTNTFAFNHEAFSNQFAQGWPQRAMTFLFLIGALSVTQSALARRRSSTLAAPVSAGRITDVFKPQPGAAILLSPLIWLIIYYAAMFTSRVPAFPWYFLPPWPLFIGVAVLTGGTTVDYVKRQIGARFSPDGSPETLASQNETHLESERNDGETTLLSAPTQSSSLTLVPAVALLLLAVGGLLHVRSVAADISRAQATEDTLRLPLALWLRDHVAPDERVLLEPIGYAGYYSRRRILDMVGLVSPEVLPYYRTPNALSGMVNGLKPEWLCLRGSERDLLHEQAPSLPDSRYQFVQAFGSASNPAFLLYRRKR